MDPSAQESNMADSKVDHTVDTEHLKEESNKDLRTNFDGEIRNPLAGLSESELNSQVAAFCSQYDFNDKLEIFQKAAMVAQNPHAFETITVLSDDDKYHLRREITHKWSLPFDMYMCIVVVSIGSALQ